jgi:hypothetical protein
MADNNSRSLRDEFSERGFGSDPTYGGTRHEKVRAEG